jgi:hypothetical protein
MLKVMTEDTAYKAMWADVVDLRKWLGKEVLITTSQFVSIRTVVGLDLAQMQGGENTWTLEPSRLLLNTPLPDALDNVVYQNRAGSTFLFNAYKNRSLNCVLKELATSMENYAFRRCLLSVQKESIDSALEVADRIINKK